MNNPFRQHRNEDDYGRRREAGAESRDPSTSQFDEGRSWRDDNPDRTQAQHTSQRDYERGAQGYGYGSSQRSDWSTGPTTSNPLFGQEQGRRYESSSYGQAADYPGDYRNPSHQYGQDRRSQYSQGQYGQSQGRQGQYGSAQYGLGQYGQGQPQGQNYGQWQGQGQYERQAGYGQDQNWSRNEAYRGPSQQFGQSQRQTDYPDHGYAPGAQIWESNSQMDQQARVGRGNAEFEPDYLHWREQQLSTFDDDYRSWRDERRQKFSSDFDSWRNNRPRTEAKAQAANPIVGEVTDGHAGHDDLKKKN